MNGYLGRPGYYNTSKVAKKESEVKQPATIFIFSEENLWKISDLSGFVLNDNALCIDAPPGKRDCFATYHNAPHSNLDKGSACLVFVDGHADMIRAEDQYNGGNYELARAK